MVLHCCSNEIGQGQWIRTVDFATSCATTAALRHVYTGDLVQGDIAEGGGYLKLPNMAISQKFPSLAILSCLAISNNELAYLGSEIATRGNIAIDRFCKYLLDSFYTPAI